MGAGCSQQSVGGWVGGWWRARSGGLTLGSGRDRPLAHPIRPWTAVSVIPVGGPVVGRAGGGAGGGGGGGSSRRGSARASAHTG